MWERVFVQSFSLNDAVVFEVPSLRVSLFSFNLIPWTSPRKQQWWSLASSPWRFQHSFGEGMGFSTGGRAQDPVTKQSGCELSEGKGGMVFGSGGDPQLQSLTLLPATIVPRLDAASPTREAEWKLEANVVWSWLDGCGVAVGPGTGELFSFSSCFHSVNSCS